MALTQVQLPEMFEVTPLPWCAHLDQMQIVPTNGVNYQEQCVNCDHVGENWLCLTCYQVNITFASDDCRGMQMETTIISVVYDSLLL